MLFVSIVNAADDDDDRVRDEDDGGVFVWYLTLVTIPVWHQLW